MSVLIDVREVFACVGHAVIEEHEQEHEPAAAVPPHKKQRTRVAEHHIQWFLSFADKLHVHGWKKKDVSMKLSEVVPGDLRQCARRHRLTMEIGWPWPVSYASSRFFCVARDHAVPSSKTHCKKEGLEVKLSREWVRAFLVSIDLGHKAAAQRRSPDVWTLPDKDMLTKRFIMKIVFFLDTWCLDWTRTYNFDETCLCLSPTGSHGWWWRCRSFRDHRNRLSLSLWSPLLCVHRLLPSTSSMASLSVWCPMWPQTSGRPALTITGRPRKQWRPNILLGQDFAVHGAYPHQCRDQIDAARRVRPHLRH